MNATEYDRIQAWLAVNGKRQLVTEGPDMVGSSYQACLATVLGLRCWECPTKRHELDDWLAARGMWYLGIPWQCMDLSLVPTWGLYLVHGPSPYVHEAGWRQCCVGGGPNVWWDPHPLKRGLGGCTRDWRVGLLLPLRGPVGGPWGAV